MMISMQQEGIDGVEGRRETKVNVGASMVFGLMVQLNMIINSFSNG